MTFGGPLGGTARDALTLPLVDIKDTLDFIFVLNKGRGNLDSPEMDRTHWLHVGLAWDVSTKFPPQVIFASLFGQYSGDTYLTRVENGEKTDEPSVSQNSGNENGSRYYRKQLWSVLMARTLFGYKSEQVQCSCVASSLLLLSYVFIEQI